MKNLTITLALVFSTFAMAGLPDFPRGPDTTLTPGTLCTTPSTYRYPERIAYCERNVSGDEKQEIFAMYRAKGFRLSGDRGDYKIDHFMPLCAGGSNEKTNLWPQHKTVYGITDPIEELGCQKLAMARITQKDLVTLIKIAKYDLSKVPQVIQRLRSL